MSVEKAEIRGARLVGSLEKKWLEERLLKSAKKKGKAIKKQKSIGGQNGRGGNCVEGFGHLSGLTGKWTDARKLLKRYFQKNQRARHERKKKRGATTTFVKKVHSGNAQVQERWGQKLEKA